MINKCNILGVQIAAIDMPETLQYIYSHLAAWKHSGSYICVTNVHTLVYSCEHPDYMRIQNNAALALPDGKPLSIICKRKGYMGAARVTGPDLMTEIFKDSAANHLRHFFYGSTPETLEKLKRQLSEIYPELLIAGMYSPPFRTLTSFEKEKVIEQINQASPDIVWVGLGAPKQEQWMNEYYTHVHSLMIGVGAGFDYHAGNIKRAPLWMQRCCLEWLYRLIQDPRRLFKRYFYTNTKFIALMIKDNYVRRKKTDSNGA